MEWVIILVVNQSKRRNRDGKKSKEDKKEKT